MTLKNLVYIISSRVFVVIDNPRLVHLNESKLVHAVRGRQIPLSVTKSPATLKAVSNSTLAAEQA